MAELVENHRQSISLKNVIPSKLIWNLRINVRIREFLYIYVYIYFSKMLPHLQRGKGTAGRPKARINLENR